MPGENLRVNHDEGIHSIINKIFFHTLVSLKIKTNMSKNFPFPPPQTKANSPRKFPFAKNVKNFNLFFVIVERVRLLS